MAVSVLLWVMPLGAFIQKSEEFRTCGGKRAVHQCSTMEGKIRTGPVEVSFSNGSGVQKAPASGQGTYAAVEAGAFMASEVGGLTNAGSEPFFISYLRSPLSPPPRPLS